MDDSHLVSCSCCAKLAEVSIRRLSWTECAICLTPMLAVDVHYWLRAQQGSVNGLHMASSCDMSSIQHSSWVPKQNVPRASIPRNSARNGRLLMTQPWKPCSVPSTHLRVKKQATGPGQILGKGITSEQEYWEACFIGGHLWRLVSERGIKISKDWGMIFQP